VDGPRFTGVSRVEWPGYDPPPPDGQIHVCIGCGKTIDHPGICYVCWNTQDCYGMGSGPTGANGGTILTGTTGAQRTPAAAFGEGLDSTNVNRHARRADAARRRRARL